MLDAGGMVDVHLAGAHQVHAAAVAGVQFGDAAQRAGVEHAGADREVLQQGFEAVDHGLSTQR